MKAFRLKREDIFLGKKLKHGESGSNTFVRLAKKDAGEWSRPVHETWDIEDDVGELKNPIIHHAAYSIDDFVKRINYYTSINAKYLFDKGVTASFFDIILYPKGKFFHNYIVKQGFRDGMHGFVHAVLMSFHSFLTRAKLYLLWKDKSQS